jgi:hypothetical protein
MVCAVRLVHNSPVGVAAAAAITVLTARARTPLPPHRLGLGRSCVLTARRWYHLMLFPHPYTHHQLLNPSSLLPPPQPDPTRSSGRIPTNGRMGEWPGTHMHSNRVSHLVLTAARPPSVDGRTVRGHAEGGRRSAPTATTVRGRDEAVRRKRAPPCTTCPARVASIRPLLPL